MPDFKCKNDQSIAIGRNILVTITTIPDANIFRNGIACLHILAPRGTYVFYKNKSGDPNGREILPTITTPSCRIYNLRINKNEVIFLNNESHSIKLLQAYDEKVVLSFSTPWACQAYAPDKPEYDPDILSFWRNESWTVTGDAKHDFLKTTEPYSFLDEIDQENEPRQFCSAFVPDGP